MGQLAVLRQLATEGKTTVHNNKNRRNAAREGGTLFAVCLVTYRLLTLRLCLLQTERRLSFSGRCHLNNISAMVVSYFGAPYISIFATCMHNATPQTTCRLSPPAPCAEPVDHTEMPGSLPFGATAATAASRRGPRPHPPAPPEQRLCQHSVGWIVQP